MLIVQKLSSHYLHHLSPLRQQPMQAPLRDSALCAVLVGEIERRKKINEKIINTYGFLTKIIDGCASARSKFILLLNHFWVNLSQVRKFYPK